MLLDDAALSATAVRRLRPVRRFAGRLRAHQLDFGLPFHYAKTPRSLFGRKSLVFVVAAGNDFETINCTLKDYRSAVLPLAEMVGPLIV